MVYPEETDNLTPLQDLIKNAIAAQMMLEPQPYDPVLTATTTNPNLGSTGTKAGWFTKMGRLVKGEAQFRFGGTGVAAGQGSYTISLPVPAAFPPHRSGGLGIASSFGTAQLRRNDPLGDSLPAVLYFTSATTAVLLHPSGGNVNNVDPWTWVANDAIQVSFEYIAADL